MAFSKAFALQPALVSVDSKVPFLNVDWRMG